MSFVKLACAALAMDSENTGPKGGGDCQEIRIKPDDLGDRYASLPKIFTKDQFTMESLLHER